MGDITYTDVPATFLQYGRKTQLIDENNKVVGASTPMPTTLSKKLAGEDLTNDVMKVEQQFVYKNINVANTTTVKSGSGFLHGITFNDPSAGGTIILYDNTAGSGTLIGTISATSASGTLFYDVQFSTGLTVVTSSAVDITISYR